MKIPEKINRIEHVISMASNVSIEELHSGSRKREIVDARAAVWYILNKRLGCTFAMIGKVYKRDHTTVMHSVRRVAASKIATVAQEVVEKHAPEVLRNIPKDGPLSVDTWSY